MGPQVIAWGLRKIIWGLKEFTWGLIDIIQGPRGHWGYKEMLSGASEGSLFRKTTTENETVKQLQSDFYS